jgi:hypothetical protein
MWVLFVDSTRKAPAAPALTDPEAVAMMKTHVAWTGKYSTGEQTEDGIKVTAHVDGSSSQTITGHDRVYFMRVVGNKLSVKSAGVLPPPDLNHREHGKNYLSSETDRSSRRSVRGNLIH